MTHPDPIAEMMAVQAATPSPAQLWSRAVGTTHPATWPLAAVQELLATLPADATLPIPVDHLRYFVRRLDDADLARTLAGGD